jgi:L-alanine-DL-glutamate epimerase-like enolase superfamily enzyme
LLKLKLGGGDGLDVARLEAVAAARPQARFILDGNEGLAADVYAELQRRARAAGVVLIEQPFPAGQDAALLTLTGAAAVCADESLHVSRDLDRISHFFDAVNIKLDKAGGLTEAISTVRRAKALGLQVMVGCMLASSLAMAPAMLLTPYADYVDLDGPLLLREDRTPSIRYQDGVIYPPQTELWG